MGRFFTRRIHEAIGWHRTMRARYRAGRVSETIYHGPTVESLTVEARPGAPPPRPVTIFKVGRATLKRTHAQRRMTLMGMLLIAQGDCCYLCRDPFTDDEPPTEDHVWPQARGGGRIRNILLAHPRCNNAKADRPPTDEEMKMLQAIYFRVDEMWTPPPPPFDRMGG